MTAIPLSVDPKELHNRLVSLNKREARLSDMGIECALKDNPEACCLACPLSEAHDDDSLKGGLCQVGVEQEQIQTALLARNVGR